MNELGRGLERIATDLLKRHKAVIAEIERKEGLGLECSYERGTAYAFDAAVNRVVAEARSPSPSGGTNRNPTHNGRGFARWEPTMTTYKAEIHVYESSAAEAPHLWLGIEQKPFANLMQDEAYAHMTLEQAEEVRNNLDTAIDYMKENG